MNQKRQLDNLFKSIKIVRLINLNDSFEDNLERIQNNNIDISKHRFTILCKKFKIKLKTRKEINYQKIIDIYKRNPTLSSRKLEEIAKQNNINVSYRTIQKIIKQI